MNEKVSAMMRLVESGCSEAAADCASEKETKCNQAEQPAVPVAAAERATMACMQGAAREPTWKHDDKKMPALP